MTTREIIEAYFDRLAHGHDWQALLAPDLAFTSFASPNRQLTGREAFVNGTRRFYGMIERVELRDLIVDADRACALTHYQLAPPNGGPGFHSDIAEVFTVRQDRIASLAIYFDTAPYGK